MESNYNIELLLEAKKTLENETYRRLKEEYDKIKGTGNICG